MQVATGGGAERPRPPSAIEGLTAQVAEAEENLSSLTEVASRCYHKLFGDVPVEPRGALDATPSEGSIPALSSRMSEINASLRYVQEILSHVDNQAG